jgi:hypothetical protein
MLPGVFVRLPLPMPRKIDKPVERGESLTRSEEIRRLIAVGLERVER